MYCLHILFILHISYILCHIMLCTNVMYSVYTIQVILYTILYVDIMSAAPLRPRQQRPWSNRCVTLFRIPVAPQRAFVASCYTPTCLRHRQWRPGPAGALARCVLLYHVICYYHIILYYLPWCASARCRSRCYDMYHHLCISGLYDIVTSMYRMCNTPYHASQLLCILLYMSYII